VLKRYEHVGYLRNLTNTAFSASHSDTENTCCVFVTKHLHQSLEELSEFLAIDPGHSYCALLSPEPQILKIVTPQQKSLFCNCRRQSVTASVTTYILHTISY
jgi:hypothetical protein